MRIGIVFVVAAVLTGPALAQPSPPTAAGERGASDRECGAGSTSACTQAPGRQGSAGPARERAGSDPVPQVNDATKDANPRPRYSGEGGAMPTPPPAPNRR